MGDQDLERALRQEGVSLSGEEVRALVAGVAAAPPGHDPDEWMLLVAPRPSPGLRRILAALREEAAASRGGLDQRAGGERLAALRAELARRGLDGFIVPRSDEHQGEYVALHAQRLAWLTGFTGSAGLAVVLSEKAAIFVDGRYTLQVGAEVDTTLFEPLHLVEQPPDRWLAEQAPQGARIGVDPWLHSAEALGKLRAACERAGAFLVACEANPVDAVWDDQPPPPISPVQSHPVAFAGQASAEKRSAIAKALAEEKVAAAVLTAPDSIAWLLNIRGGDISYTPLPLSFAILHADAAVDLFIDPRKLMPGLSGELGPEVRIHPPADFAAGFDALRGRRVRVDRRGAPAWVVDRLQAADSVIDHGPDPCALPKACKNAVELEGTRRAHRRDGAALCRFLAWLAAEAPHGAVTETMAAERLEMFRARNEHFRGLSFPTISGAGPNGAIVHYRSTARTDRRLEPGSLYLVDSGAQYRDGTTDVTRTVVIGPPGAEERRRFTLVLKGHIAMATARFPAGTTGSQLDILARRALWEEGLDYDHGTGHGVGSFLGVHEGPQRVSKMCNTVALKPGMILSNEPGYYKPGAYGIRIENLVAVTDLGEEGGERPILGFETLTLAPIDLALIDAALLDAGERAWLDGYHARVRRTIGPLVDSATLEWLERATMPVGMG